MQALVIGAGNFGATVAAEMTAQKCEVVVIESNAERADDIKDKVSQVIVGDATDKDLLKKFAQDMDLAVISLGDRVDASVLITLHLKELGMRRIIAKVTSVDHGKILRILGAHQIVFPERDEAIRLVSSLVSPSVLDLVKISDDLNVVEIAVPDDFVNKSIANLNLRKKFGLQILAIKNSLDGKVNVSPPAEYTFRPDDVMIVIGDTGSLKRIEER
jgi:trk system potassium uptake protein TrkA